MEERYQELDVLIAGGGPAGLAAAVRLWENGIRKILIAEREKHLGGILRQCIHDGFGLTRFKETLSGPEYAGRFIDQVKELQIPYITNASVTHIGGNSEDGTHRVQIVTREGLLEYRAKAVVLAMGCRERTRGALAIPGERPAGVYTAGVAQAYMNLYNRMPAREAVILGSGDIGMIMARRLTLEGAHVQAVFELQPYPSGLNRNIRQCLEDFGIPLYLSHTVTNIHGTKRLEGVTVSEVDRNLKVIPGTEKYWPCDTLILSVGLLPENELSREAGVVLDPKTGGAFVSERFETSVPGIFAAGNVLHVHDLADYVSMEAEDLADAVTEFVTGKELQECRFPVRYDSTVHHVIPQKVSLTRDLHLSFRVTRPFEDCRIEVLQEDKVIAFRKLKKALPAEMLSITVAKEKLISESEPEVRIVW